MKKIIALGIVAILLVGLTGIAMAKCPPAQIPTTPAEPATPGEPGEPATPATPAMPGELATPPVPWLD